MSENWLVSRVSFIHIIENKDRKTNLINASKLSKSTSQTRNGSNIMTTKTRILLLNVGKIHPYPSSS